MSVAACATGERVFLFETILCIILSGLFFQCYPAHPPRTEIKRERISDYYDLIDDSHLDSLCREFNVIPPGSPFEVKDNIVRSSACHNPYRLGHYPADYIELAVEKPCTVSIVITDSLGNTVAWRHFRQNPPPADSIHGLRVLFPRLTGRYRYNLLIRDSLLESCPILLTGKMLYYIEEE